MRFRRATAAVSPLCLLCGHSSLWFHPQFLGGSEFALVHVEGEKIPRAQVQGSGDMENVKAAMAVGNCMASGKGLGAVK